MLALRLVELIRRLRMPCTGDAGGAYTKQGPTLAVHGSDLQVVTRATDIRARPAHVVVCQTACRAIKAHVVG